MAKRKKAAPSSAKKKTVAKPEKKVVKKIQPKSTSKPQAKEKSSTPKLDVKKMETISNKISKINNNFECLINECKSALNQLAGVNLSPAL